MVGPNTEMKIGEQASKVYHSVHRLGFNESKTTIDSLRNLNRFQVQAMKLSYNALLEEDRQDLRKAGYDEVVVQGSVEKGLEEDLEDQLHKGEFAQVKALLKGVEDQKSTTDELAAGMYSAMKDQFLGTGWGVDRDTIMERLRNLTPQQAKALEDSYQTQFKRNLRDDLKDELKSFWNPRNQDPERAIAMVDADQTKSDAIWFDQALYTDRAIFSSPREDVQKIHDAIEKDVQKDAEKNGWKADMRDAVLRARLAKTEATYNDMYANKIVPGTDGLYDENGKPIPPVIRGKLDQNLHWMVSVPEGDLMSGLLHHDMAAVGAARIQVERKSVIYASDKEINATLQDQYDRAYGDVKLDLAPGLHKRLEKQLLNEQDQAKKANKPWTAADLSRRTPPGTGTRAQQGIGRRCQDSGQAEHE